MDKYLERNLEAYLAGQLGEHGRREFEERLAGNPSDREVIRRMQGLAGLFSSFDLPLDAGPGPRPGFHRQVLRAIEEQRRLPFWDIFLRPLVARRLVLAACIWLLVLFAATAYRSAAEPQVRNIAQSVLAESPESADYCNVRLGCDIDLNRSTMLAAVIYSGGSAR